MFLCGETSSLSFLSGETSAVQTHTAITLHGSAKHPVYSDPIALLQVCPVSRDIPERTDTFTGDNIAHSSLLYARPSPPTLYALYSESTRTISTSTPGPVPASTTSTSTRETYPSLGAIFLDIIGTLLFWWVLCSLACGEYTNSTALPISCFRRLHRHSPESGDLRGTHFSSRGGV